MNKIQIVLSDADIQDIINGRNVRREFEGTQIEIRESYLKDVAAPAIKDRFEVKDTVLEKHIADYKASIGNSYELGS